MVALHHWYRESADLLLNQGQYREAAFILRVNLTLSEDLFSESGFLVLSDRDSLSDCLHMLGDYTEAISLDWKTLNIRQEIDKDGEGTIATLLRLAHGFKAIGERKKALPLYRSALDSRINTLGLNHDVTLKTLHDVACCLGETGHPEEASNMFAQILTIRDDPSAGVDHDDFCMIAARHGLATSRYALGDLIQAAKLTDQNLLAIQGSRILSDPLISAINGLQHRIETTTHHGINARRDGAESLSLTSDVLNSSSGFPDHTKMISANPQHLHDGYIPFRGRSLSPQSEVDRPRMIHTASAKENMEMLHRKL